MVILLAFICITPGCEAGEWVPRFSGERRGGLAFLPIIVYHRPLEPVVLSPGKCRAGNVYETQ